MISIMMMRFPLRNIPTDNVTKTTRNEGTDGAILLLLVPLYSTYIKQSNITATMHK
jgi:hypothetical protein